ncbi:MAG TPA: hypothetical protein V6D05_02075 [Stenomitos sp.]
MKKILFAVLSMALLAGCGTPTLSTPALDTDSSALRGQSAGSNVTKALRYLDDPGKGFHRNVTGQALLSLDFSLIGTAEAKQKAAKWLASADTEMNAPYGLSERDGLSVSMLAMAYLAAGGSEAEKTATTYLNATDKAFHRNVTEQALLSIAFSRLGTAEAKQKAAKWLASAETEMNQPNGLSERDELSQPMLAWAYLSLQ